MSAVMTTLEAASIGRLMLRAASALHLSDIFHRDHPSHIPTPELQRGLFETAMRLLESTQDQTTNRDQGHEE